MAEAPLPPERNNLPNSPRENVRPGSGPGLAGFVLLILLGIALLGVTRPSIRGNDGVQNYSYLRSMVVDGDLDFTNDYSHYLELQPVWFDHRDLPRDPVTSRPMNLYGVGSALLWAPAVVATHQVMLWVYPERADGFSGAYECAVGYSTAFYATVGLWLLWGLVARRTGRTAAFWGVVTVWLGSPLFFYMYLHPSMSHGNSFLAVMLMLRLLDSRGVAAGRLWAWAGLGLAAGLVVLVRFQDGILILIPMAAEVLRLARGAGGSGALGRRLLRRCPAYVAALLAGAAMLSLQMAAWSVLQGSWWSGPRAYGMQGSFRWPSPHILQVWFSAYHGLFHWHPLLLAGIVGLLVGHRAVGPRALALLGFFAASYVIGCWSVWWAGASFGHRMFISSLPAMGLGLGVLLSQPWIRRRMLIAPGLCALAVWWNFGLVFQYATEMIPRNRPASLTTLAWNNTLGIPMRLLGRTKPPGGNSPVEQPDGTPPASGSAP